MVYRPLADARASRVGRDAGHGADDCDRPPAGVPDHEDDPIAWPAPAPAGGQILAVDSAGHEAVCPGDVGRARGDPVDLRLDDLQNVRRAVVHSPTPAAFLDQPIDRDRRTRQPQLFSTPMRK